MAINLEKRMNSKIDFWLKRIVNDFRRISKCMYLNSFKTLLTPPIQINPQWKYLVVSPHPDDETFGCGNLIAQIRGCGGSVRVLFLSKGEKSCRIEDEKLKTLRVRLATEANRMLGNDNVVFLDWPDGGFSDIEKKLTFCNGLHDAILDYRPDVVLYPHEFDNTDDHRAASRMLRRMLRKTDIKQIMYCVWLWDDTPWRELFRLRYEDALVLMCGANMKTDVVDYYAQSEYHGTKISGNLPVLFLKMMRQKRELFFKVKP